MASTKYKLRTIFLFCLFFSNTFIKAFDGIPQEETYCATWSSSQYLTESKNLPPIPLSNNSIRQIVHVSVASPTIRLKFSNRLGEEGLEIKAVSLADSASQGSGEIDVSTLTPVKFKDKESVVIPAGSEMYSDPFYYPLKEQSEVAISIYFGEVPSKITSHAGSRTFSFIEKGNKINEKKSSSEFKTDHWYIIEAIEVSSSPAKKAVVCYGDSITDGRGSTNDKQNRWTDVLAKKLYLNDATREVACVNAGIGATLVRNEGQERFERDVLNIKGSAYIIVLYGVNDILFSNDNAEKIIDAYKVLIKKAHESKKLIYGATILPFGKNSNYNDQREKVRNEVNNWIRKAGTIEEGFDAFFDFDEVVKDPNNGRNILGKYDSGDGLHPSPEGYQRMVEAINNLKLFTTDLNKEDDKEEEKKLEKEEEKEKEKEKGKEEKEKEKEKEKEEEENKEDDNKGLELTNKVGIRFELDFELEKEEEVTIKVKGSCDGSNGFRLLTNNDKGEKTSDYYYTGKIKKGDFELSATLEVNKNSKYVIIRRPISTMNIDKIILKSVEVKAESGKKVFKPKEGVILN